MEFIESEIFTECITVLLTDQEYRNLQAALVANPKAGDVIRAAGGLRKLRWRTDDRGKRSGLRIIYYYWSADRLYMVFAYRKSEQDDLTTKQLKTLLTYVKGGI